MCEKQFLESHQISTIIRSCHFGQDASNNLQIISIQHVQDRFQYIHGYSCGTHGTTNECFLDSITRSQDETWFVQQPRYEDSGVQLSHTLFHKAISITVEIHSPVT